MGASFINNTPFIKDKLIEAASHNPYAPTKYLWE